MGRGSFAVSLIAVVCIYTLGATVSASEAQDSAKCSCAIDDVERSRQVESVLAQLSESRSKNEKHLSDFLRFQSVSSDPKRLDQVEQAADWLRWYLSKSGFENVVIMPTDGGRPLVYADWMHASSPCAHSDSDTCAERGDPEGDVPTVLIYGHYDVQPEDPVDLWTSPPFEPTVRDGRLYARGAADDKGNMLVPVHAAAAWLNATGSLPVNVKFMFEGEEEIGSPYLRALLDKRKLRFQADYLLSADGGQIGPDEPGLCLGVRGSVAVQVDVYGSSMDAHSGTAGGGVKNPLHALAHIIDSLHDPDTGRIAFDGAYDDVLEVTDDDRSDIAAFEKIMPADETLKQIGANESYGEKGYGFYERTWARPTVDVVGMWGGFQGEGLKTVLPKEAHAKVSARIVANQNPEKFLKSLQKHIEDVGSQIEGVRVEANVLPFFGAPYLAKKSGVANRAATSVLADVYGKQPNFYKMGGSIPVLAHMKELLDLDTTVFAFGNSDENIHAPDEFARLDILHKGSRAYVQLFDEIAQLHVKEKRGDAGADTGATDGTKGEATGEADEHEEL